MKKAVITLLTCFLNFGILFGQAGKKKIDESVYPIWKTIKNTSISNDGKWITYEINPLKGDGWLYIVNTVKNSKDSVFRGCDAQISANNEFVVFKIKQPADSVRKLKLKKTKDEDLPKDSAGIWMLKTRKLKKFDNVKSFKTAPDGGSWVAMLLEEKKEKNEKKDTAKVADTAKGKQAEPKKDKKKAPKQNGTDLLIYNPMEDISLVNKLVTEYSFSKNGALLSMVSVKKDSVDTVAVSIFTAGKAKADTLMLSPGTAKNPVCDEAGQQLAFLFSQDTGKVKQYRIMGWNTLQNDVRTLVDTSETKFPPSWRVSENQVPKFSEDGALLYFSTAPRKYPEPKDTILDEEKVKLDLWSWTDGRLQPQQLKELDKDKKQSFMAAYFLKENKIVQLADTLIDRISLLKKNTGLALGITDLPYEKLSSWEASYADYYIVDVNSGKKDLVLKKQQNDVKLSPLGKYLVYYNYSDSSWNAYSVKSKTFICLTAKIPVKFFDEEHDAPEQPSPYGIAGWTEDDGFVLVYDRYDIWKIDPQMLVAPENITRNGRSTHTEYRYVRTDREAEHIDTQKPLLLTVFDTQTRQSGFASLNMKNAKSPVRLIFDNYQMNFITKARKAEKLIFTKESFTQYPDLQFTDTKFSTTVRVSDANPQQKDYYWGSVELVNWTSFDGIRLEGLLYKPENFNASKKYPVIVYFYERNADNLNRHWIPSPSRSIINPSIYCSNGYIVFIPDIRYSDGYPGNSAYNCVVSGTEFIKKYEFVDAEHIGIQGQSWGGYQVAYLVTRTTMYRAAMAGAAVTNMTSAYGGIRWGTGISRMSQYEQSQSRIGANLWQNRDLFIQNSPLFYADKISTPLLLMNNDNDGAVPWYQGIELFTAMRRLDKPVWMLNYNGDEHNLEKWPNRIDLSIRMMQFFDHYLKGKPMPQWMKTGIPALEKGKITGYELVK
ncbi:MAG TPA: prolyl oligopeptidase family serine peptidase [Bacteroidales bacterium]|nr:prolyl oligopeptidase family serine peptidase [Bacteroidales bacterium]HPI30797.1 prolyl oligopeptidase family serine peptidase [Bacteroidales bacterium]